MGEAAFFLNGPVTNTLGRTWMHLLWQGLTVGLLLAGAEAMFGPRSAVGRYRIAGASLLLLAVLPAVALLIPYPAFALPAEGSAFFLWIVAFWLAGSGLLGLRLAVGWLLIRPGRGWWAGSMLPCKARRFQGMRDMGSR